MADLDPLCSPSDVRNYTNIDPQYKGLDKSLLSFIGTVSSQVRGFCRRDFVKKERTEYFRSPDGTMGPYEMRTIEDNVDPTKPFTVLYNEYGDFRQGYAYIVPPADMRLDYEVGGITVNGYGFRPARKGFAVTYTGGYPRIQDEGHNVLDVPEVVRRACAMQCAAMLAKVRASALGKTSVAQNNGGLTENYDRGGTTGLIREVSGALLPLRRKLVGRT